MNQTTTITVDVARPLPALRMHAKQNDTSRVVAVKLIDNGVAYSVPTGAVAIMRAGKPDGTGCFYDDDITIDGNVVTIPIVEQVLTAAGTVYAEVNLYNATGDKLTSFAWQIEVEKSVIADSTIISSDYFNALTALAQQILSNQGNRRYSGTAITGTSTTPTVYAVDAGTYSAGDWYQNSGSGADRGNVYRCTFGGDKDTALWVYEQNYNGAKGNTGNAGAPGSDGATFTPSVSAEGVISWTNDGGKTNPNAVNIKGPKGDAGIGVPATGTTGHVLTKTADGSEWAAPTGGANGTAYHHSGTPGSTAYAIDARYDDNNTLAALGIGCAAPAAGASNNVGFGANFDTAMRKALGADANGLWPVSLGGTGAENEAAARTSLDVPEKPKLLWSGSATSGASISDMPDLSAWEVLVVKANPSGGIMTKQVGATSFFGAIGSYVSAGGAEFQIQSMRLDKNSGNGYTFYSKGSNNLSATFFDGTMLRVYGLVRGADIT